MLSPISLISRLKILPKKLEEKLNQKPSEDSSPKLIELQNIRIDPMLLSRVKIDLKK